MPEIQQRNPRWVEVLRRRLARNADPGLEGDAMNAIMLFLTLVLNGNMTCGAEIPDRTMLGDQLVQIQVYDCYWSERESASHQFVVISPVCPTYVAQPVLIKEMHARKGWVMNRFGEFYPATTNIEMMDVYRPPC